METKEQIENYYQSKLNKDYQGDFWQPRYRRVLEILSGYDREVRILDIGCGAGDLLLMLKEAGFRKGEGLDYSAEANKFAQGRGLKITLCDFDKEIPKFKEQFDVVICADTLEHIFEPEKFLRKIKPLLKPEGKLILTVPNAGWYFNGVLLTFFPGLLRLSPAFGVWTHCNQFTVHTLKKILTELGYETKKVYGVKYVQKPPEKEAYQRKMMKLVYKLPIGLTDLFSNIIPSIFSSHLILKIKIK